MNSKYSVAVDEPKRDQVSPISPKDKSPKGEHEKTSANKDKTDTTITR